MKDYEKSDNDHLRALGLLTVRSAKLEEDLQLAFISLVGSKYAAIVAGGQSASWLIEQCQALVKANLEITSEHKDSLKQALDGCKAALEQRNILVHGLKHSSEPGGEILTARSRRGTFEKATKAWPNEIITDSASQLSIARSILHDAIRTAVKHEDIMLQFALQHESRQRLEAANE